MLRASVFRRFSPERKAAKQQLRPGVAESLNGFRQRGRRFSNPPMAYRCGASRLYNISLCRGSFSSTFIQAIALTPASGYRNSTSGALTNVSTYGYSWSSSPSTSTSTNGGSLYFRAGYVYPMNGDYRAHSFPVRCVQHLQAAFSVENPLRSVKLYAAGVVFYRRLLTREIGERIFVGSFRSRFVV